MSTKRRKIIIIGAIVLLIAVVAYLASPYIYKSISEQGTPAAPTLSSEQAGSLKREDLDGEWSVSSGSYAGYRVDEVLQGVDVNVVGRTEKVSGNANIEGTSLATGEVTVDMESIKTNNPTRDGSFRSDILHTEKYPTAKFKLIEPVEMPATLTDSGKITIKAPGELTIHGVTKPVTVDLEVGVDGKKLQVAGRIPMTFADYNVEAPKLPFVTVEKEGFVEFLLVLEHK